MLSGCRGGFAAGQNARCGAAAGGHEGRKTDIHALVSALAGEYAEVFSAWFRRIKIASAI